MKATRLFWGAASAALLLALATNTPAHLNAQSSTTAPTMAATMMATMKATMAGTAGPATPAANLGGKVVNVYTLVDTPLAASQNAVLKDNIRMIARCWLVPLAATCGALPATPPTNIG